LILRAEVQENERPVAGHNLSNGVLDDLLARSIKPMKVFEENYGWLPGTACACKPPHHIEEAPLPRFEIK
jgi:hypothetical protein